MPEDNTVSFRNVDFIGGSELVAMEGHGLYHSLVIGYLQSNEIFTKDIFVCNQSRHSQTIHLDGGNGNIIAGGSGADGDLFLKNSSAQDTIHLNGENGNIIAGGSGADGDLFLKNSSAQDTIHLDGDKGDIILLNADCAEDFDITVTEEVEPGTVMVINEEGGLRPSTEPYDKKVAGVISGAGNFKPGMILDRQPGLSNRMPIALMGKVYCKVDAQYAPIEVGDLLTTSPTAGHAMKATDPIQAFGCVLGKALKPCEQGQSLIEILVTLQ
jgi:hypothetical protein